MLKFFDEKMWVATHIFSAKNIRIFYIESAKIVNELTLNKLVKLTTLWTTGPRSLQADLGIHMGLKTHCIWSAQIEKASSNMHKMCRFRSSCTFAKYNCSPFIHSVVSNDSVSGRCRPWSDCMDEKADLGLCCLHVPNDMFSHSMTQTVIHIFHYFLAFCINPCHAEYIKMPHPLLIFSQSDYLIQIVYTNSHT